MVLEKSLPPSLGEFGVSYDLRSHTQCWRTTAKAPEVLYIPAANKVDNLLRLGKDNYLSIGDRLLSIALILIQW